MKGLVKEFLILLGIIFILYFLFTKTPLQKYSQNLLSGFFSYFTQKEEKIVYFSIFLTNDSKLEIDSTFDIKLSGILKEIEIDKLLLTETSENLSEIFIKCQENCNLKYFFGNLNAIGKSNFLILNNFKISNNEKLNFKIQTEKINKIDISITSSSAKICLTNSFFTASYGDKKIEQKIYEDCLSLEKIIKIIFSYSKDKIIIEGYASYLKSTFISI